MNASKSIFVLKDLSNGLIRQSSLEQKSREKNLASEKQDMKQLQTNVKMPPTNPEQTHTLPLHARLHGNHWGVYGK